MEYYLWKNNAFTASFWIKVNDFFQEKQSILFSGSAGRAFLTIKNGKITFSPLACIIRDRWLCDYYLDDMGIYLVSDELSKREWHHIIITQNENKISLYIDGKKYEKIINLPDTLKFKSSEFLGYLISGNTLYSSAAQPYKGLIDEFTLYARALDDNKVMSLYSLSRLPQSKLTNSGTTDVRGKLNILIQQYNQETNSWKTLNDKSILNYPLTVKGDGGIVKLDKIFNSKGYSFSEAGKYRVVASFVSEKGTKVESSWEFGIVS